MRPKKHETTGSGDLFRARLEQIINMKHELVLLAGKIEWQWIDSEIAPLYSDKGRPGIETRFVIGLLLLKHIYGLSDEGVCERWVHDPYFQHFTGEEFFQHEFPHERSDLSHWRKRLGNKLELLLAESLRVAHQSGALRTRDLKRVTVDTTVQPKAITFPTDAKLLAPSSSVERACAVPPGSKPGVRCPTRAGRTSPFSTREWLSLSRRTETNLPSPLPSVQSEPELLERRTESLHTRSRIPNRDSVSALPRTG